MPAIQVRREGNDVKIDVTDPLEVINDFVKQVSNLPPNERERLVLQQTNEAVLAEDRSR